MKPIPLILFSSAIVTSMLVMAIDVLFAERDWPPDGKLRLVGVVQAKPAIVYEQCTRDGTCTSAMLQGIDDLE